MSDHGFARCDGEFESIGEDLDMSTMGILYQAERPTPLQTDISRELALLEAHYKKSIKAKEDKHMLPIGTKVIVRTCNDYNGRYSGRVGTVRKQYLKTKRTGVMFDGIKNPDSKEGLFWFSDESLTPYDKPTTAMVAEDVKNVIFSGNKTIVLWSDGTKTIVTCGADDIFDPYAGFCAAVTKKVFGTTSIVKRILKTTAKEQPSKSKKSSVPLDEAEPIVVEGELIEEENYV